MQEAVDELIAQQIQQEEGEEFEDGFDMLIQNNPHVGRRQTRRTATPAPTIAPEPPVTLDEWEATKELRCRFCPHPTDATPNPPQLPLADAPWTQFRCGCRIHTVCFAIYISVHEYHRGSTCPCCQQSILTPEQRTFLWEGRQRPETPDVRAKKLWEENEVFREELKEVAKEGRSLGPLHAAFVKDKEEIKREWKEAVGPSVCLIRHHKQIFSKRYQALESRKKYCFATARYKRKLYRFLQTYDLDQSSFEMRRGAPKGMPKIRRISRWGMWRYKAWHIFRVRL